MTTSLHPMEPPSIDELRTYLTCKPRVGVLRWRMQCPPDLQRFRKEPIPAGVTAVVLDKRGVPLIAIPGRAQVRAAHIIWALVHGAYPEKPLAYKDGSEANIRISNLSYFDPLVAAKKRVKGAKKHKPFPTQRRVRELLKYDRQSAPVWKATGQVAGTVDDVGQRSITVDRRRYRAADLCWLWVTGNQPSGYIAQRDGDLSNFKWLNLMQEPLVPVTVKPAHATKQTLQSIVAASLRTGALEASARAEAHKSASIDRARRRVATGVRQKRKSNLET